MFLSGYKSEPGVVEFSVFRSSAYYQYCCFCPWSVVKTENTPTFLKYFLGVLGCVRYHLTQHRVNLRVLAEERYINTQTVHDGKRREHAASPFFRSFHNHPSYYIAASSLHFKMASMCSERLICAPPRLSGVSPTLPLKQFQCLCD